MLKKIAALLLVPVLLAGCSAAGDVETGFFLIIFSPFGFKIWFTYLI